MSEPRLKIGVVAPGSRLAPEMADRVKAVAAKVYPQHTPEIIFHPQCFLSSGHFAGDDTARAEAFLDVANDESFDALWFARGGYGACRILDRVMQKLTRDARKKTYLGYSDAGSILGALYNEGFQNLAHGPLPADIKRDGGEAAVTRALRYLVERDPQSLEANVSPDIKAAAFNIVILGMLIGTPYEPDLSDHVLMLEEISEHMYRIDRMLFHLTSNPRLRRLKGLRLGRCSDILPNEPDFGQTEEQVARHWCDRSGIPYLGRADIGHDIHNKVVPFGVEETRVS